MKRLITKTSAVVAFFISYAFAPVYAIEFNTYLIDKKDRENIDFSKFSSAGYFLPGNYTFDIYVNNEFISSSEAVKVLASGKYFKNDASDENTTTVCIPLTLAEKFAFTESVLKNIKRKSDSACINFSDLDSIKWTIDSAKGVLNVQIPKTYLEYSSKNWTPISRWDDGIAGFILDYNINASWIDTPNFGRNRQITTFGTTGLNAGSWRLRADYQGELDSSSGNDLRFTQLYLFKPIPSISSRLLLGETYASSALYDSWRYTGVELSSDVRMLPPEIREYAPEIIGIAKTNAKVTITQLGRIVHESVVPPGSFNIQDIDGAIRGQMDVKITEENGEIRTFSVSTANVPYLVRPGSMRYKLYAGRPTTWDHNTEAPVFSSGELTYGISNNWSTYGGAIVSPEYNVYSLGIARNLNIAGAVAFDISNSQTELKSLDEKVSGKSYRLSYSKHFDEAKANITFAGYRFSQKNYLTMQEYIDSRKSPESMSTQKQRLQVFTNKTFDTSSFPLMTGLNYEYMTYWDGRSHSQYGLNVGTYFDVPTFRIKNVSLQLTATKTTYESNDDNIVNLSLSIPFENATATFSGMRANNHFNQQASYYSRIDEDKSYNLTTSWDSKASSGSKQLSAYVNNSGDALKTTLNASVANGAYKAAGASVSGGITATRHGIAMNAMDGSNGARLMLDTDGVSGISLGRGDIKSNRFGLGVISGVSEYYKTSYRVGNNSLDDRYEIRKGVVEKVLTEGAIGYQKIEILKGRRFFAIIRMKDGSYPAFGTSILDAKGIEHGIVGDEGVVWLSGVSPKDTFAIDGKCKISIPEERLLKDRLLLPCE